MKSFLTDKEKNMSFFQSFSSSKFDSSLKLVGSSSIIIKKKFNGNWVDYTIIVSLFLKLISSILENYVLLLLFLILLYILIHHPSIQTISSLYFSFFIQLLL